MPEIAISGLLRTVAPFHLAHANVPGEVDASGRPRRLLGGVLAKLPCTMTYKVPMVLPKDSVDVDGDNGYPFANIEVPTIPSTSIRGRIRRHAANVIKEHFIANGMQMSRKAYSVLQVGAFAGNAVENSDLSPVQISAAREHLFAGVFGGGPAIFQSYLITPDAYACTAETCEMNVLPVLPASGSAVRAFQLTFAQPFVRRDDLLEFLDPLASEVVADYQNAFSSWQKEVLESQQRRKASRLEGEAKKAAKRAAKSRDTAPTTAVSGPDAGSVPETEVNGTKAKNSKVMLRGQSAVEAVMPNAQFAFTTQVFGSDPQCGLVLAALIRMFEENRFGGFVRNGFGRLAADLSISIDDGPAVPFVTSDGFGKVQVLDGARPYLDALSLSLMDVTPQSFDDVYLLVKPKKDQE